MVSIIDNGDFTDVTLTGRWVGGESAWHIPPIDNVGTSWSAQSHVPDEQERIGDAKSATQPLIERLSQMQVSHQTGPSDGGEPQVVGHEPTAFSSRRQNDNASGTSFIPLLAQTYNGDHLEDSYTPYNVFHVSLIILSLGKARSYNL